MEGFSRHDPHQFVQAHHSHEICGPLPPQIGGAVEIHGQQGQRALIAVRKQSFQKRPLLGMGLGGEIHEDLQMREEFLLVSGGPVAQAREVDADVLNGRPALPPGGGGIFRRHRYP